MTKEIGIVRYKKKCPSVGKILWEILLEEEMTPRDIESEELRREEIDKILDEEVGSITPEVAIQLENELGLPAYFWLDCDRAHRKWRYGKGNRGRN